MILSERAFLYVVDRRPRYDLSYAVSEANSAPSAAEALIKAKEWAKRSGVAYYVHELGPVSKVWQPIAKVTP